MRSTVLQRVPRAVWYLGVCGLLINASSVICVTFVPIFLINVLGANMTTLGILEGTVEATALLTRFFSGFLSDRLLKRKPLIILGYIMSLCAKALLACSSTVLLVFTARFFDRFGNGLQASPRDALTGDLAPQDLKGACYGLRQTLSVVGSFLGAFLGIGLMWLAPQNYSFLFICSWIPLILACLLLASKLKEPQRTIVGERPGFRGADIAALPLDYWKLILLSFLFMLGNLSGSFLVLDSQQQGMPTYGLPLIMVLQNFVTAVAAFPCGKVSDRIDRRIVLGLGFFVLTLSHFILGLSYNLITGLVGIALCGLQLGITQSLLSVFVVQTCPAAYRGTGFGIFHFFNGIALLFSNAIMGYFWDAHSSSTAFYITGLASLLSLMGLPWLAPKPESCSETFKSLKN